jgi:hypothetical protein
MTEPSVDDIANAMFELVKSTHGKKNMKAMDLTKAMIEKYGDACERERGPLDERPARSGRTGAGAIRPPGPGR